MKVDLEDLALGAILLALLGGALAALLGGAPVTPGDEPAPRPPSEEPTTKMTAIRRRRLARASVPPELRPPRGWRPGEDLLFLAGMTTLLGFAVLAISWMGECNP